MKSLLQKVGDRVGHVGSTIGSVGSSIGSVGSSISSVGSSISSVGSTLTSQVGSSIGSVGSSIGAVSSNIRVPLFRRDHGNSDGNLIIDSQEEVTPDIPTVDFSSGIITMAARTLTDAIQEILCNGDGLNDDDLSGFFFLVKLLESDDNKMALGEDLHIISSSRGMGCLSILLNFLKHRSFCDSCLEVQLAPALIHALRLLRMMEVKALGKGTTSKSNSDKVSNSTEKASQSLTLIASERVCRVLSVLCGHSKTLDQLREQLLKLLCLPISILPETAVHLQVHVAKVISSLSARQTGTSLTAPLVAYLHDSSVMLHINRALKELTSMSNSPTTKITSQKQVATHDSLLRGPMAERANMWLVACGSLVDLLLASLYHSNILLLDFEAVGGYETLIWICLNTAPERSMKMINILNRLLTGDHKNPDQQINHPEVGKIFLSIISSIFQIHRSISSDDNLQTLTQYCQEITRASQQWLMYEHIFLNIAYTLLTAYSEHSSNFVIVEKYHPLLPTVTLCFPACISIECAAAILKLHNYLYLCMEVPPTLSITALCSTLAVVVQQLLANTMADPKSVETDSTVKVSKNIKLTMICNTIEEVIRMDSKYASIFMSTGILDLIICPPLEHLESFSFSGHSESNPTGTIMNASQVSVFSTLFSMVSVSIRADAAMVVRLRSSSLIRIIRSLISNDCIQPDFVDCSMVLLEQMIRSDSERIEEHLHTIIDLLRVVKTQYVKANYILVSVTSLLVRDLHVPWAWQTVDGFGSVLSILASMKGKFLTSSAGVATDDAAPAPRVVFVVEEENEHVDDVTSIFECMGSALSCIAAAFRMTVSESSEEQAAVSNRKYFRDHIGYSELSRILRESRVFTTHFAEECVDCIFSLLTGDEDAAVLVNPDAAEILVELLPDLEVHLAARVIRMLLQLSTDRMDGGKLLCEAGITSFLVVKYGRLLNENNGPLCESLQKLIHTLCSNYLELKDFAAILQHVVKPLLVPPDNANLLLPPWVAFDKQGYVASRPWDMVESLLVDLVESPGVSSLGVPYLALGSGVGRKQTSADATSGNSSGEVAHLYIHWVDSVVGRPFPVSSFSYTCWLKVGELRKATRPGSEVSNAAIVLPIICLSTTATGVFLDAVFNISSSSLRVSVKKGKSMSVIDFDIPFLCDSCWHLIALTFHRSMRFGLSKALLTLYMDGEKVGSEKVESEVPSQGIPVDVRIGKSTYETQEISAMDISSRNKSDSTTQGSMMFSEVVSHWLLGPLQLFEDVLNQTQISYVFITGPNYSGTFQAEFPISTPLPGIATEVLSICNRRITEIPLLLESLALAGLELVTIQRTDAIGSDSMGTFQVPAFPVPVLSYSVNDCGSWDSTEATEGMIHPNRTVTSSNNPLPATETRAVGSGTTVTLFNVAASDNKVAPAQVVNGWYISKLRSIPSCVASMGGPDIIFPIIQAASTENQLCISIRLLRACVRLDSTNLTYMLEKGYKILAYFLTSKPKDIITDKVMYVLFDLAIDKGLRYSISSLQCGASFNSLLVDTNAFVSVLLSHHVWDMSRFEFAKLAVNMVKSLIDEDCRHSSINSRRLGLIGMIKWLLLLTVNGAESIMKQASTTSTVSSVTSLTSDRNSTTWCFKSCSAEAAANSVDPSDPFLSVICRLLSNLLLSDLQHKDLIWIAYTIMYTLRSDSMSSSNASQCSNGGGDKSVKLALKYPYSSELTSLGLFRVYLFRLVLDLHSVCGAAADGRTSPSQTKTRPHTSSMSGVWRPLASSEFTQFFVKVYHINWFLTILERACDVATTSLCLRLLVTCLQLDDAFMREFCSPQNFRTLTDILCSRPQIVAIVTPVVCLLFRIPMSSVANTADFDTSSLMELIGTALGPDVLDTDTLLSCYLPMFVLLLKVFTSTAKLRSRLPAVAVKSGDPSSPTATSCELNEVVVSIVFHAAECNDSFRQLLQHRIALEALATAMASLGLAADRLHHESSSAPQSPVASPTLLPSPGITGNKSMRIIPDPSTTEFSNNVNFPMLEPEGQQIQGIISKVIRQGIFDYKNSQVVVHLLLSMPRQISEIAMNDFQRLLLNTVLTYVKQVYETMNVESMQTVGLVLTSLVPLGKARLLVDEALFEIMKYGLLGLKVLTEEKIVSGLNSDKANSLIKDYLAITRYFSILSIHSCLSAKESSGKLFVILQTVRANMHILTKAVVEDQFESYLVIPKSKRENEEKLFGMPILDSFHIGMKDNMTVNAGSTGNITGSGAVGGVKKTFAFLDSSNTLALQHAEKHRLSQVFLIYLLNTCYTLFLDDHVNVRTEAMRLCASLLIHRKQFVEELIGDNSSGSALFTTATANILSSRSRDENEQDEDTDFLIDGIFKLLPNLSVNYGKAMQVKDCIFEGEESRFAEFSYWLTDNGHKFERLLVPIEHNLTAILPSHIAVHTVIRLIQSQRSRGEEQAYSATNAQMSCGSRGEEFKSLVGKMANHVTAWMSYGIADTTAGAMQWREIWQTLQSGPIWGPVLYSQEKKSSDFDSDKRIRKYEIAPIESTHKFRLSALEGPERARLVLEPEFDLGAMPLDDDEVGRDATGDVVVSNELVVESETQPAVAAIAESQDIEEFLKKFADKGLIAKQNSADSEIEIVNTCSNADIDIEHEFPEIDFLQNFNEDEPDDEEEEDEDEPSEEASRHVSHRHLRSEILMHSPGRSGRAESYDDIGSSSSESVPPPYPLILAESSSSKFVNKMSEISKFLKLQESSSIMSIATSHSSQNIDTSTVGLSVSAGSRDDGESTLASSQAPATEALSEEDRQRLLQTEMDLETIRRGKLLLELAKSIISPESWTTSSSLSIQRINGLETQPALLVITQSSLHILDGLQVVYVPSAAGEERAITWRGAGKPEPGTWGGKGSSSSSSSSSTATSSATINLSSLRGSQSNSLQNYSRRRSPGKVADGNEDALWMQSICAEMLREDMGHHKIPLDQVFAIFRRRYHLKSTALEVSDINGFSLLFACNTEQEVEAALRTLLETEMPNSVFSRVGMKNLQLIRGGLAQHKKLMSLLLASVTKMWSKGELSNFEYLMHLNACAGRSYQDLTQYPVFPWVLSDYSGEEIDLEDPSVYRDLSLPMGAVGEKRAQQYMERYKTMRELQREGLDLPPPFFYGTHYSCAGYVLHWLLRMQPYSRMAVTLQGGHFDKADRLFKEIASSWRSASQENLQDVMELIPEFFCQSEFLVNSNKFEFGNTQSGDKVDNVILPPWAKGDPALFVKIHRQALESHYVSENLHHWIDLIFGYKQRGLAAAEAMNVFVHLTYDGMVDVDAITDPLVREATIVQLNSFGQTPGRLFLRPHPKRQVPEVYRRIGEGPSATVTVDPHALAWREPLSPPLCIVGAHALVYLTKISVQQVVYPMGCRGAVGDMRLAAGRDRVLCVPLDCLLVPPKCSKYLRFRRPAGGISFHTIQSTPRPLDSSDRPTSSFERLHPFGVVTCAAISRDGATLVTGGEDGAVRIWSCSKKPNLNIPLNNSQKLSALGVLCGHGGAVNCVDVSSELCIVVSGSTDGALMLWDTRRMKLLRHLGERSCNIVSLSINCISGLVVALQGNELRLYSVNGESLASAAMEVFGVPRATVVLAPPCGLWQDGVVAVTGHEGGHLLLWKLQNRISVTTQSANTSDRKYDSTSSHPSSSYELVIVLTPMKTHRADISALRLCSNSNSGSKQKSMVPRVFEGGNTLELLVGDVLGWVSRWAPTKLEQLPANEIQQIFSQSLNYGLYSANNNGSNGGLMSAPLKQDSSLGRR